MRSGTWGDAHDVWEILMSRTDSNGASSGRHLPGRDSHLNRVRLRVPASSLDSVTLLLSRPIVGTYAQNQMAEDPHSLRNYP